MNPIQSNPTRFDKEGVKNGYFTVRLLTVNVYPLPLGKIQTLFVTFTPRTFLKDVLGHSNRTSGDISTGCPAMSYFCIFTLIFVPPMHIWVSLCRAGKMVAIFPALHKLTYMWPACRTPKHPVWNIQMAAINENCQKQVKIP